MQQEVNEKETEWPFVSLLVLNWNGRSLLETCLPPLLRLNYPAYEIVVVDNGSTDDSVPYLREHFPTVRLVETGENLGFSRGMNAGLRRAEGEVVVLLNNDVIVLGEEWLRHLVRPLLQQPDTGITGGKLLFPDRQTIQHAGAFLTSPLAYSQHTGHGEQDNGQYDQARDVPYVTGAAMAIARPVLDDIGLLDEQFHPFYYEEVDFCWRARAAGYRVHYVPQAVALHDESFSLRQASRFQHYTYHRNRLRFVLKHYAAGHFLEIFVPAERARLREQVSEKILPLERKVLVEALHELPQTLAGRGEEALLEEFQDALLQLREDALARVRAMPAHQTEEVATLAQRATLDEWRFSSDKPLVGSLIAAFRQRWHDVAGKWALRHLRQQQERFNHLLLRLLQQQAAGAVARDDQIHSNAADIDALLRELLALQRSLAETITGLQEKVEEMDHRLAQLERQAGAPDHETVQEDALPTGES